MYFIIIWLQSVCLIIYFGWVLWLNFSFSFFFPETTEILLVILSINVYFLSKMWMHLNPHFSGCCLFLVFVAIGQWCLHIRRLVMIAEMILKVIIQKTEALFISWLFDFDDSFHLLSVFELSDVFVKAYESRHSYSYACHDFICFFSSLIFEVCFCSTFTSNPKQVLSVLAIWVHWWSYVFVFVCVRVCLATLILRGLSFYGLKILVVTILLLMFCFLVVYQPCISEICGENIKEDTRHFN